MVTMLFVQTTSDRQCSMAGSGANSGQQHGRHRSRLRQSPADHSGCLPNPTRYRAPADISQEGRSRRVY